MALNPNLSAAVQVAQPESILPRIGQMLTLKRTMQAMKDDEATRELFRTATTREELLSGARKTSPQNFMDLTEHFSRMDTQTLQQNKIRLETQAELLKDYSAKLRVLSERAKTDPYSAKLLLPQLSTHYREAGLDEFFLPPPDADIKYIDALSHASETAAEHARHAADQADLAAKNQQIEFDKVEEARKQAEETRKISEEARKSEEFGVRQAKGFESTPTKVQEFQTVVLPRLRQELGRVETPKEYEDAYAKFISDKPLPSDVFQQKIDLAEATRVDPAMQIQTTDEQGRPVTKVLNRSTALAQGEFPSQPTTDTRNRQAALSKIEPIVKNIARLSELINTQQGVIATLKGATEIAKAKVNLNDDVSEYTALVSGFTPLVARAVGHSGVLTQQDVDSVRELFPKPTDSKSVRDRKVNLIMNLLSEMGAALPEGQTTPDGKADKAPPGVDQAVWDVMTPQERALWKK